MSTVKITDLSEIVPLNANTSNTVLVGVDIQSDITGKISVTTLAAGMFANNALNVGNNAVVFPGVIGQFASNNENYLQVNLQNFNQNGSGDYVVTADIGTDTTHYIDLGLHNSNASDGTILNLDGYLFVQGNTGQAGGNLIIGTATTNRDILFVHGGLETSNVIGKVNASGLLLSSGKSIYFGDGTVQTTSFGAAATYANGAFIQANAAFLRANTPDAIANSAALYANGAFAKANAALANTTGTFNGDLNVAGTMNVNNILVIETSPPAASPSITTISTQNSNLLLRVASNNWTYISNGALKFPDNTLQTTAFTGSAIDQTARNKANSALANTSGTFDGNLSITGNLNLLNGSLSSAGNMSVNGTIVLANSNFSATESAITIKATANVATPSNDGYMLHISGKQNVASRIVFDSYSVTGNAYAVVAGRTARGTVDAPLAAANGDILMRISGNGHGGANAGFTQFGVARIDIVATENYSSTNRGSQIQFWNCPVGSNTLQRIASFNGDSVSFTGVLEPQKGFVYTPRNLGAQTAITIDFANDSMIRATYSSTLTMSFTNYTYGKIVEVWLTNTAGTGQTINLGVLANNSTTGSATLSVASNRSAKLQYFSIDGDLANTFCAITYA